MKEATLPAKPKKEKGYVFKEIRKNKVSYAMIAPYMILFFLFTVIPVVSSCVLSFTYFNMLEMPEWRGWMNYTRLFLEDDIFLIAVKNTLMFAILTGPLSYVFCFIFAWFINELPNKVRSFMTLVFYAPSMCSSVYFIWQFIFSGDSYGVLNSVLIDLGLIKEPVQWLGDPTYMMVVIIIIQLWLSLGTSFLSFMAGFKTLDSTLYEAGAIDGIRNRFQELIYITLPSMKPQLMFGAVMQISAAFSVDAVPRALAGFPSVNYAVHTVVTHIYDYGSVRYEMGYASAIAFLLALVMILLKNLIAKLLVDKD